MAEPPVSVQDRRARPHELQAMLDAVTHFAIIRLDIDGNIASWSAGAQRLEGYTAAEALGQPVSLFYPDEDRTADRVERELATAREKGGSEFGGWRVRKGGKKFWANIVIAPIHGERGEVTGYTKILRDDSNRREQELRLLRQRDEILELSTPVIEIWDKILALPVIGSLDSHRASMLTEKLLKKITQTQCEIIILDIGGVPAIDTQVAQHLVRTTQAAALMGATCIMSGIRPETAQAMVHLGIDLGRMQYRNTLRDALQLALHLLRERTGETTAEATKLDGGSRV